MGLFGQSVDEVQQSQNAQRQAQALQIAQLTNGQLTNYNGALTGGMIADGIRGAFGVPNTQMNNANKLQSIQAETEQEAPFNTDPLKHMQLAISKLMQNGLQTEAANAMAHYKEYAGAQSQQQTAQANLIKAQREQYAKVKDFAQGTDGKTYANFDDGTQKELEHQTVANTGSAPSLIQYQNARDNLMEALKQDPNNQVIINKISEINKIIPTLGQSAQFVIGPDGTVYSGDKKTGSFGLAGQGTQNKDEPIFRDPIFRGNDLSAEEMHRLQKTVLKGGENAPDAIATLQAYAQFKGQQGQPEQGQQAPTNQPININGTSEVTSLSREEKKNMSWEDFTSLLKINLSADAFERGSFLTAIGKPPQTGRGPSGLPMRKAYEEGAAKIGVMYDKTPEEMSAMPDKWKTDLGSLRLIQKQTDTLEGYLTSFHNNLESWDKVARGLPPTFKSDFAKTFNKMDFTGIQTIDEFKIKLKTQFNDPTAIALGVSALAAAMDMARINAGGSASIAQTAVTAMETAHKIVNASANDKAREALKSSLEQDALGQLNGRKKQLQVISDRMGFKKPSMNTAQPQASPTTQPSSGWSIKVIK